MATKKVKKQGPRWELVFPWRSSNYLLLLLGVVVIIVGYITLSIGPVEGFWTIDVAPVLLVLGYCVIVPVAIMYRKREKQVSAGGSEGSELPK